MIEGLTERLIVKKDGTTGWLTFNNPDKRNAMSVDMWEGIPKVLAAFEADPGIRAIVLTGAGDKAFVSGADISQFEQQRSSAEAVQHYEEIAEGAQRALLECGKPTIARIKGFCIGGGLGIANACDLRIASEDSRFAIPAAKMGLAYRASSMKMLVDNVGPARARDIMITARQFTAAEAAQWGLIQAVVPTDSFDQKIKEYCDLIGANAPLTMRAAKRMIRAVSATTWDVEQCKAWVRECFESADYKEGRKAFMEKRKPVFTGK